MPKDPSFAMAFQRDPPEFDGGTQGNGKNHGSKAPRGRKSSTVCDRCTKKSPSKRELVAINEVGGAMVLLLRSEANEHAVSIRMDLGPPIFPKSPRIGFNCSKY